MIGFALFFCFYLAMSKKSSTFAAVLCNKSTIIIFKTNKFILFYFMKRTLILSLCMCVASAIFAQRHDTVVIITKAEAPVEKAAQTAAPAVVAGGCCTTDFNQKTYANDPKDGYYFTNWELAVKGGINYLNAAPAYPSLSRADVISFNAALDLVYNFNDAWGIKGGLGCYGLNRTGLEGYAIDIDLQARANLTNLIAPHRSELSRRFNVYAGIGMGYAPILLKEEDLTVGHYGVGVASLEAEARFSKLVGLFIDGELRAYFTSPKQAVLEPNPYRPCLATNIGLRFHF